MIEGLAVAGLVAGFPVGLLALVLVLDRFETAFVEPDERAAAVVALVATNDDPDELEEAVADLLAPVVAGAGGRRRATS